MSYWLWACAGCAASAAAGFSLVRFALPSLTEFRAHDPRPTAAPAAKRRPLQARAPTPTAPAPTAPEPDVAKLVIWTRQIEAGERKMSIATDGCRVTWNRTCKHGHPTWIVHLGYLERDH